MLPFPSPGDLPNPGIEPRSPTLQADSLPAEPRYHWANNFIEYQFSYKLGITVPSSSGGYMYYSVRMSVKC